MIELTTVIAICWAGYVTFAYCRDIKASEALSAAIRRERDDLASKVNTLECRRAGDLARIEELGFELDELHNRLAAWRRFGESAPKEGK